MDVFGPMLNSYCNVQNQLWDHLREKTMAALAAHSRLKEQMTSRDEVVERGRMIRQVFLDSLGGLPPRPKGTPAVVKGIVRREGYRIERVVFESEPDVHVPSLLYVPDGLDEPAPGVLFVSGHGREAKAYPEYQRVCHDLARNGFVTLAVDPTGQGERVSLLDPDTGEMAVQWGTAEHSYQGVQCILTGTSIARYFLFDALRGIDYLQMRPEVDGERIGVTGNSGGGTQTTLICMSGDERVKAAMPCTYVTSREHYFMTGQPQDAEQIQFGMTANGINYDDMFLPFAPRPLLIGAVASDFFPAEGTALTAERLKRLYRLCGREDDVDLFVGPGMHFYSKELREAAVNFFRMHLAGLEPDFETQDDDAIAILPDEDLWCTNKGHVRTDYPADKTPFHRNLDCLGERQRHTNTEALRNTVVDVLCIRDRLENPGDLFPRFFDPKELDGFHVTPAFFASEPNIYVSGCIVAPPDGRPDSVEIVLAPGGTGAVEEHLPVLRDILGTGAAAFVCDVRGTGAVQTAPITNRGDEFPMSLFNSETWMSFLAYCMGECLLGMRVFDVLRAAHFLRTACEFGRVGLRARGLAPALTGYLAAALDGSLNPVRINDLIESFETVVRAELYSPEVAPALMVHGILQRFDLPDLEALAGNRRFEGGHDPGRVVIPSDAIDGL